MNFKLNFKAILPFLVKASRVLGPIGGVLASVAALLAILQYFGITLSQPAISKETAKVGDFYCSRGSDGIPTTFARTAIGDVKAFRWVSNYFQKYDPQNRCEQVSNRFQILSKKGQLKFITSDRMNGQNVVCVAPADKASCFLPDGLLYTLKPEQKPNEEVNKLKGNQNNPSNGPLDETERVYINVDELLEEKPVEPLWGN